MTAENNFITIFFKLSQKKYLTLNTIQEKLLALLGAVFAERSHRTIRNLLERPVFEKGDGNWIDVLPTITKKYNSRVHSSTKLTPKQASLKKNEGFVYKNLLDKRKKVKPKF